MAAPADLDGLHQLIPPLIGIDGIGIATFLQHFLKGRFDFLIPESGRLAGLIAIVLVVTVPDVITFARTAQPPDFVAIKGAAVATDESPGKRMLGAYFCPALGGLC